MIFRVYIDTSVIGGFYDEEFKEHSKRLFDDFEIGRFIPVISDITDIIGNKLIYIFET